MEHQTVGDIPLKQFHRMLRKGSLKRRAQSKGESAMAAGVTFQQYSFQ
jgi:hypothetical protein